MGKEIRRRMVAATKLELSELYKDWDGARFFRVGRLSWAGHESIPKRLLEEEIQPPKDVDGPGYVGWL